MGRRRSKGLRLSAAWTARCASSVPTRTANALRLRPNTCAWAVPPLELFIDMVKQVVKANERFIPPYGTGASLYIRPVLFGSGPQVGVKPADEYLLIIFVTPVGPYYKEGFNPIRVIIDRDHDRAAPLGTGHIKAGGNYGASLISSEEAHDKGYPSVLYLDAKEKNTSMSAGLRISSVSVTVVTLRPNPIRYCRRLRT